MALDRSMGRFLLVLLPLLASAYPPEFHGSRYNFGPIPRHTHTSFVQYNCGPLARVDCSYHSDYPAPSNGPEYHGNYLFHGHPQHYLGPYPSQPFYEGPYSKPYTRPYPQKFSHSHAHPFSHAEFPPSDKSPTSEISEHPEISENPKKSESKDPPHFSRGPPSHVPAPYPAFDHIGPHSFGYSHPHGFHLSFPNFKPVPHAIEESALKEKKPFKAHKPSEKYPTDYMEGNLVDEVEYLGAPVAAFGPNYAVDEGAGSLESSAAETESTAPQSESYEESDKAEAPTEEEASGPAEAEEASPEQYSTEE